MESSKQRSNVLIGAVLVVLGIAFLVVQTFKFELWNISWPLYVIVPGVVIIIIALGVGKGGLPLTIFGTITTVVGLILWYQEASGNFESWSYAWALVVPGALGLGTTLHGLWTNQPELLQRGLRLSAVGLVLFLVGLSFFEWTLDLSGFGESPVGRLVGPVALIGLGVYLLWRQTIPARTDR
jgi:hypothetical protein